MRPPASLWNLRERTGTAATLAIAVESQPEIGCDTNGGACTDGRDAAAWRPA
ncbi:hypothetical protein [Bifidobacterium tibiigranuli]|uniref:hypothetical protein n=1 Tax=Bifidobacterium tibiigranuli TaxID=2172043 RepID=UPI0026F1C5DE|nr:hypothetical protein [Bifidobacterium tibiigranuli]MCI1713356.1 hypothetical protein [Bifidobacterium tibiigranuli]